MKYSQCPLFSLLFLNVLFLTLFSLTISGDACPTNKFTCANEKCIPLNWRCDGEPDCGEEDESDEEGCEVRTCSALQFDCSPEQLCIPVRWTCDGTADCLNEADEDQDMCDDRTCPPDHFDCGQEDTCIPMGWVCDTDDDCGNGQDESDCGGNLICPSDEWMCADRTQCISARWHCDHEPDCDDESDELECEQTTCASDHFQCETSLLCFPDSWRCDGDSDCEDESDEANCTTANINCAQGLFMCGDGDCIHNAWRCDGEEDCDDGTDESDTTCPHATCRPDEYQCENGRCVIGFKCDGYVDCEDGSDEEMCPTTGCSDTEFTCNNGDCIPSSQENDGIPHCPDGEDEAAPVAPTAAAPTTPACGPGYERIAGTCEDVNECKDWTLHACSQQCVNHDGSYTCNCAEGFQLSNHTHCKALGDHPLIVYVYQHGIRTFNITSRESLGVYSELRSPLSLEIDIYGGHVFWSDAREGTIMMGSLDGNLEKDLLVENVNIVDGIGYDWIHKNLYWTNSHNNTIGVISLDTRFQRTLFSVGMDEPRALVVDPRDSFMFWTDWGSAPKIERAAMDGSERQVIVDWTKTDISWPNGLAIDYYSNQLFWVDAKHHKLASCDFYGEKIRTILMDVDFVEHPFQLAVFQDAVYWTDWDGDSIRSANKLDGTKLGDVVGNLGASSPNGIAVWQNSTQPLGENYCVEARCSHISVAAPLRSCSCLCPDGIDMSSDGVTCVGATPEPIVTDSNIIPSISAVTTPTLTDNNKINPRKNSPINHDSNHSSLIWIIVLALGSMFIIVVVIIFFVWKRKASGGKRSMNFDNPVYRKTTDDELFLNSGGHTYEHNPGKASKYQPMIQTDDVI